MTQTANQPVAAAETVAPETVTAALAEIAEPVADGDEKVDAAEPVGEQDAEPGVDGEQPGADGEQAVDGDEQDDVEQGREPVAPVIRIDLVGRFENVPVASLDGYEVNPNQRNHGSRAFAASETYLARFLEPHREFTVAKCRADGKTYMVNGHTRREVYQRGYVAASEIPETINVTVYEVDDLDGVKLVYDCFDSAQAVKTKSDGVFGVMRSVDIHPQSAMLTAASWLEMGLRLATALQGGLLEPVHFDTEGKLLAEKLDEWRDEIGQLDSLRFGDTVTIAGGKRIKHPRLSPGMATCALMLIRVHGDKAVDFLTLVRDGKGKLDAGLLDPVQAVTSWRKDMPPAAHDLESGKRRLTDYIVLNEAFSAWVKDPGPKIKAATYKGVTAEKNLKALGRSTVNS